VKDPENGDYFCKQLNISKMKAKNNDAVNEIFEGYSLTCEEMIRIRGGEDTDPVILPNPPKVKV